MAVQLGRQYEVTVIDWNPNSFDRLPAEFDGETVVGNGVDVDVLMAAGVAHADVFLALTDGDNRNLMAAQIARSLGVRRCVARVYDAIRSEIFGQLGITTFSPTVSGARRLFEMVTRAREAS